MPNLISIIIPCYNQAQYLNDCLQSIFEQTYSNWECIIINDGSLDNSEAIAKRWEQKDARFKYVKKENGGLSNARNTGLSEATGDFIQFLDSDDLLSKQKIKVSIDAFLKFPDLDVVITNYNMIDGTNLQRIKPYYNLSHVIFNFKTIVNKWDIDLAIPIHCAIFKKSSIATLQFNESLRTKEDWLFWIHFFKYNTNSIFIDQQLVTYRKHSNSMTQSAPYMLESQNIVLDFVKQELSREEYEAFLLKRLNFHQERYLDISSKYSNLKNGLTYSFALQLKNVLQTLGLYTIAKSGLQKLRK